MTGRAGLTSVEGLVQGDLHIVGCTSSIMLGESLRVHGNVYILGHTGILDLSPKAQIDGKLHVLDCTGTMTIPECFTATGSQ